MGKDALNNKLKKIVLINKPKLRELQVSMSKDGTLEINGSFDVGEESRINPDDLKKKMEKVL